MSSNTFIKAATFAVNDSAWTQVLPANGERDTMAVQNKGDTLIYIGFGDQDETLSVEVPPGGFYEPFVVPSNPVEVKAEFGGTSNVLILTTYKTTVINN
jgi:hypothetical protein